MELELLRLAVRALLTYMFLLGLLRVSGKWTIRHGTTVDFVLAIVIGDLVDNVLWQETPFAQFVVAASTLVVLKLMVASLGSAKTPSLRSSAD